MNRDVRHRLLPVAIAVAVLIPGMLCGGQIPEILMLMSPERQQRMGYDRQRKMYPAENAKRISGEAVQKGFQLLHKNGKPDLAQEEFNRAWRFWPSQYGAWWGSGIVRSLQARQEADPKKSRQYWLDSIKLLEKTVELAPPAERQNAQSDLAQSYSACGDALRRGGDAARGDEFLKKGEALAIQLVRQAPENGRCHYALAVNAFYRRNHVQAQLELAEAERCKYHVDPEFKKAVTAMPKEEREQ